MQIKKVFILPFILAILSGCTKEDLSDCVQPPSGVILKYNYLLNMDYTDLFEPKVADLKVFIFGQDSILYDTLIPAVKDGELNKNWSRQVELIPGSYTIVTWAGDKGFLNTFGFTDQNDPAAGNVIPGQTRMADFIARLKSLPVPGQQDQITPWEREFNNLFYGIQGNVVVQPKTWTTLTTSLIKDTKTIRVKVGRLSLINDVAPDESDFDMQIIGRNGQYRYDNTADEEAPWVKYEAGNKTVKEDTLSEDFTTLRLRETSSFPLLTVIYKPTNWIICRDLDITELILKSKIPARDKDGRILTNEDGSPEMVYPTAEYLDRQDLFEIIFQISSSYLDFTIKVNGWEIQNIIPVP